MMAYGVWRMAGRRERAPRPPGPGYGGAPSSLYTTRIGDASAPGLLTRRFGAYSKAALPPKRASGFRLLLLGVIRRGAARALRLLALPDLDDRHCAASGLDQLPRRLRDLVRRHFQRAINRPLAEHLEHALLLTNADKALRHQRLRIDLFARREGGQVAQVDDGIDLLERVLESAQIRHPLREAVLAALEVRGDRAVTRARLLALLAPARRLHVTRAMPAPNACAA